MTTSRMIYLSQMLLPLQPLGTGALVVPPSCRGVATCPKNTNHSKGNGQRSFPTTVAVLLNNSQSSNNEEPLQQEDPSSSRTRDLGFDKPARSASSRVSPTSSMENDRPAAQDRLRKSLDDSAKFKIRNDARFTWLAFFLVSAFYSYSCFNPALGYLTVLGLPDSGLAGGAAGALFALASLVLFFAPELFGKKTKN
jgi:hypothetical protein